MEPIKSDDRIFEAMNDLAFLTDVPMALSGVELRFSRAPSSYYPILARSVLELLDGCKTGCHEIADGLFAACLRVPDADVTLLLGPVAVVRGTNRYARDVIGLLRRPSTEAGMLLRYLHDVPLCSLYRLLILFRLTASLLFGLNVPVGETLTEASSQREEYHDAAQAERMVLTAHDNADYERQLYSFIRFGNTAALEQYLLYYRDLDQIDSGIDIDVQRSLINSVIASIGVASHAANEGGLPYGIAMNMADDFIRRAERCRTVKELSNLHRDMLICYARLVERYDTNQAESPLVYRVRNYVGQHLSEPLTVQDIAETLGFNRSYLSTQFNKETGMTLNQYIGQRKTEEAKRMLVTSDWSVQRIADALGFASQAYFSMAFRRQTGYSPSDFRQKRRFLDEGKY